MNILDIPIPQKMRRLKKDRRGYPIPANVLIDSDGRAHFTINDEAIRIDQIIRHLCPICGLRLKGLEVFVGGPRSAFDEHGAYIDLPMHPECATYALKACPYLAAPVYSGRIDAATLKDDGNIHVMLDQSMIPERPDFFVAVYCHGHRTTVSMEYLKPQRPYQKTEYWQHGKIVPDRLAEPLVQAYLAQPVILQPAKVIGRLT